MKGLSVWRNITPTKGKYMNYLSLSGQLGKAQVIFIASVSTTFSKCCQTAPPADRIIYSQHLNEVSCLNWVKTFRFISNKNRWCQSVKIPAQLQCCRSSLKMQINLYRVAFKVYFISAVFPIFQKKLRTLVAQQAWMMNVTHLDQFLALWLQQ